MRFLLIYFIFLLPGCLYNGLDSRPPGTSIQDTVYLYWSPPTTNCLKYSGKAWLNELPSLLETVALEGDYEGIWDKNAFQQSITDSWIQVYPGPIYINSVGEVSGYTLSGGVVVKCTTHTYTGALIHEWIHLWGNNVFNYPDPNHELPPGWWTNKHTKLIQKVKEQMAQQFE